VAQPASPGIRVQSPSFGPSDTLVRAAPETIAQVHAQLTPFLLVPGGMPPSGTASAHAAPPVPYDPALLAQGVAEADAALDDTRAFPEQLFAVADVAAKQFTVIRTSPDYNEAGRARQLETAGAILATGAQTLTDRLVKTFTTLAADWVGQARDPGRTLLLGKGVPPDVMQLVAMCATAPIALVSCSGRMWPRRSTSGNRSGPPTPAPPSKRSPPSAASRPRTAPRRFTGGSMWRSGSTGWPAHGWVGWGRWCNTASWTRRCGSR